MTKIGVIYYSYSGKTRDLAESIAAGTDADLIEIKPKKAYTPLSVVPVGCYRALRGGRDPIIPEMIDVSGYDLLILASPVWAGRETPIIRGGIDAFLHQKGKPVFAVLTCGKSESGNRALLFFKADIEQHGMTIRGDAVFDKETVTDDEARGDLIKKVIGERL